MSDPFGIGGLFGGSPRPRPTSSSGPERVGTPPAKPLPQIRGRREGDVLWVRADDVADALESQSAKTNARLIAKLRGVRP